MSRSVHGYCYPSVSECPPVPANMLTRQTTDREVSIAPLFPEIIRPSLLVVLWLIRSCFYLKERFTLEPANMIQLSKYCIEYSTLTHTCQMGILLAWKRNQNTQQCGLPRKICKRLLVFGNCMGVSQIWRRFAWLSLLWLGKSRPPTHHTPKGRAIHPPLRKTGAFWPVGSKR